MKKRNIIEELNELIEINNDRIEGYKSAYEETNDEDLKEVFNRFKETSIECKHKLSAEVRKLGGEPTEATKTTGKLYSIFMELKAAIVGKERRAILESCEYGEDVAVKTYKEVLEDEEDFSPEQADLIRSQYQLIRSDHDVVKSMRNDSVAETEMDVD